MTVVTLTEHCKTLMKHPAAILEERARRRRLTSVAIVVQGTVIGCQYDKIEQAFHLARWPPFEDLTYSYDMVFVGSWSA